MNEAIVVHRDVSGPLELLERLDAMSVPEPNSGCWLWLGHSCKKGYGRISARALGKRSPQLAHRVSWTIHFGDPGELCVLHKCDTPACINPDHLFLGTLQDNNEDMNRKGRRRGPVARYTCPIGHSKSRTPNGLLVCMECRRRQCQRGRLTGREAENARARELYHSRLEESRRIGREKQQRIRERRLARDGT